MNKPIVSLCMPTNGVIEWVFPVLESIEKQGIAPNLYEVIITDNGENMSFKKKIRDYVKTRTNIVYAETHASPFINEIESYRRASGQLIKFINHRTLLVSGALEKLIQYAIDYVDQKPVIYFANGVLKMGQIEQEYSTFDDFVRNLSYWSSWSTGMTIWKDDFEKLPKDGNSFNELFPHTNVLFAERNREKYIINNTVIFDELPQGKKAKGNYDLFFAFGVEYPSIILELYRCKDVTIKTFQSVLQDNLEFLANLYVEYFIKKTYCSYDLSGITDMYDIFYTKRKLQKAIIKLLRGKCLNKIKSKVGKC